MPVTSFPEYARAISDALNKVVASGHAGTLNLQIDQRSTVRGFISGLLLFNDGSELHLREYVDMTLPEPRIMYAYHYQDANKELIFRYDNAAHRPRLLQAEHKHTPARVVVSTAPTLTQVIDEIL